MSQATQICTVHMYFCTVRCYLWRARLRSDARRVMLTFSRCQTLRQRRYQMSPPHYGKIPLTTRYLRRNQCEHIRSYVLESIKDPVPRLPRTQDLLQYMAPLGTRTKHYLRIRRVTKDILQELVCSYGSVRTGINNACRIQASGLILRNQNQNQTPKNI